MKFHNDSLKLYSTSVGYIEVLNLKIAIIPHFFKRIRIHGMPPVFHGILPLFFKGVLLNIYKDIFYNWKTYFINSKNFNKKKTRKYVLSQIF